MVKTHNELSNLIEWDIITFYSYELVIFYEIDIMKSCYKWRYIGTIYRYNRLFFKCVISLLFCLKKIHIIRVYNNIICTYRLSIEYNIMNKFDSHRPSSVCECKTERFWKRIHKSWTANLTCIYNIWYRSSKRVYSLYSILLLFRFSCELLWHFPPSWFVMVSLTQVRGKIILQ